MINTCAFVTTKDSIVQVCANYRWGVFVDKSVYVHVCVVGGIVRVSVWIY